MPGRIYVGVDFSLNSPAFCCFTDSKFHWGSLTRSDRTFESLTKTKDKPYSVLFGMEDFSLLFLDKKEMPSEYSQKERIKIDYFLELVEVFWSEIEKNLQDSSEVFLAMEGLSFASNGNALIDISMATALLRERIVNKIGSSNFWVFSPTSVKKFAVKGNAKKDELYHAILNKKLPGTNFSQFTNILQTHKENWITNSGNVNKPLDDIIDASWICLYLMENEQ